MDARDKVWKQLQRNTGSRIERVVVESSPVFAPHEFHLHQLTVLTGTHGAGKSYLFRVLDMALGGGYGTSMGPPFTIPYGHAGEDGIVRGKYTLSYTDGDISAEWSADLNSGSLNSLEPLSVFLPHCPETVFADPTTAFGDYNSLFGRLNPPHHLSDPHPLRRGERDALRAILGKSYESFVWYDAQLRFLGDPIPHFEAKVAGRNITTRTMSMGELWVHYCLWMLRTAEQQIVFIDGPEAFLSPAGHAAFLDEIARLTLAYNRQTIIATHSAAMIKRTPSEMLRVLTPSPIGTRVIIPSNPAAALRILGHEPGLAGVVLVEDELAGRIVVAVLARFDRSLADRVEIIDAGGKDNALAAGGTLARSERLGVCVALDGDQRNVKINSRGVPVAYLPGQLPDEAILAPAQVNPGLLAERLGVSEEDVTLALDSVRFGAHQYWFTRIAEALHLEELIVVNHLIAIWLQDEGVQVGAQAMVQQIRAALLDSNTTGERTRL